ncbi:tRNA (cytosine(38)-C(5))-methyltransferase isoform X2 [Oratosquilla oratoria]|uniref:tRNA (cytosine(38)-C(5))-methyltransferase isoform X2 n=1 Tax=Oratosquilla oratoria TaxID=337810 RepID=UPI003F75851B
MSSAEKDGPVRILELYSGIGGMHAAAIESGLLYEIVGSYEINPSALEVYKHNFTTSVKPSNILGLTVDTFIKLRPDLIMMSPPCQPFTRQGLKQDVNDTRTSSFLHVLELLKESPVLPHMILLENVAGFEVSQARGQLVEVLKDRGFAYQEFLLSPAQFGVPNSRLRYYLLAKRKSTPFPFTSSQQIHTEVPVCLCINTSDSSEVCSSCLKPSMVSVRDNIKKYFQEVLHLDIGKGSKIEEFTPPLEKYIIPQNCTKYLLKEKILTKYAQILDIVNKNSTRSCCFTKGYAHYVEGTGSVLQSNISVSLSDIYSEVNALPVEDTDAKLELLRKLELRYFTPEEVLRLMCFPEWFTLPQSLTDKQKYKVLGNSINVLVVTQLLRLLSA